MKVLFMQFDGEYQLEQPIFEDAETAWNYVNDLGSKWYFYPFVFLVTDTGKTIVDTPREMEFLNGKRVASVAKRFEQLSNTEEAQGMEADAFAVYVINSYF